LQENAALWHKFKYSENVWCENLNYSLFNPKFNTEKFSFNRPCLSIYGTVLNLPCSKSLYICGVWFLYDVLSVLF
jgi:hypothetical protein